MTDDKLQECVAWYVDHFGKQSTPLSTFETFLIGHCHVTPRQAREIRRELQDMGLVSVSDGKVIIL